MRHEIYLISRRNRFGGSALALLTTCVCCANGCGIPELRSPQAGAAMPADFQSTNWYRAPVATAPTDQVPAPNSDPSASMNAGDANTDTIPKPTDNPAESPNPDNGAGQPNSSETDSPNDKDKLPSQSTRKRWYAPAIKLVSFVKPSSAIKLSDDEQAKSAQQGEATAATTNQTPSAENVPTEGVSGTQATAQPAGDSDSEALNTVLLSGGGWQADATSPVGAGVVARFDMFHDPILLSLIQQAIVGNQELKVLAEEVQIACYEVQARSGAYLPFVDYRSRVGVEKSARLTREGAVEDQLEGRPGRAFPDPLPDFMVGTTVSWELDIWKRLRNSQRSASMRYLATREGRNYVITGLVAEVAENYYELLALDNRLLALNQMIAIQQKSLEIARAKKESARETELAVQRFQAEVRKNESNRLIVLQDIIETENRINSLLGRYPQPIPRPSVDFIAMQLNSLATGIPPELLRNRADIRQAERDIQATGLDIQVAKARFYPSLGISAGVGYRAFDARYLFSTPDSLVYSVAGDLVGPLINKRAIQAEYRTANARQLQSVYTYQQTVIDAFTEVVNFLSRVENYGESIEFKKQQLESLEKSVDVATKLFQNARAEYMEVLLAQRDLMEVRMTLIETKQQQLSALVSAYRALGGGAF